MTRWSGRVRRVERRTTGDALAEGATLVPLVRGLADEQVAWLAVVVRPSHLDLIDPRPLASDRTAVGRFLAGLTRSVTAEGPALAVGLAGNLRVQVRMRTRSGHAVRGSPVGVAFLEAPDCDWWMWQRFLGPGTEQIDPEQIRSGHHGDPLPPGLGRWWSLGRRTGVRVSLSQVAPSPPLGTSPLVH